MDCHTDHLVDCHVYIPWMTVIFTDIYKGCMMSSFHREVCENYSVVVYYPASSGNFSHMSRDRYRSLPTTQ